MRFDVRLILLFILPFLLVTSVLGIDQYLVGDLTGLGYYKVYNITNLTADDIFQGSDRVLDVSDINGTTFNYSSYSNNSDYLEDRNTNEVGSYLEGVYGWITNSVSDLVNYYTKSEVYNKTEVDTTFSDYSTTAEVIAFGYYNSSDFVITDYFTKTQIGNFGYYNSSDFNIADYFTSAEVLAFNYYNLSDFDITDYVTGSTLSGYNYYNSSDFDINDYILSSNESNLDVNSANYWDNLNTPSDINAGDITDDDTYVTTGADQEVTIAGENITSGTIADVRIASSIARDSELISNCSIDSSCANVLYSSDESGLDVNSADLWDSLNTPADINAGDITDDGTYIKSTDESSLDVNSADFWDSLGSPLDFSVLTATGVITANEFNGALNWSYLQNYPASCPADTYLTQLGDSVTCTGIADVYASNSGDNLSNEYQFSGLVSLKNETIISDITSVDSKGSVLYQSLDSDWLDLSSNTSLDSNLYSTNDGTMTGFERNDGTVSGGVSIEDDGMYFGGESSNGGLLEVDNAINTTQNSFYSIWFTAEDGGVDNRRIIEEGGVKYINSDEVQFEGIGSGVDDISATYGIPMNIILSFEQTETKVYINGTLHGTGDSVLSNPASWRLGNRGYLDRTFYGTIDSFVTGSKTISLEEAQEIYDVGKYAYFPIGENLAQQYSGKDFAGTEASPTTIYDTNMVVKGHSDEVSALSFDGVDDYVDLGTGTFNPDRVTLSAWFKTEDDNMKIIDLGDRVSLEIGYRSDSNKVGFHLYDGNAQNIVDSNTNINNNNWHNVIGVYNGKTIFLYLDGNLENTITGIDNPIYDLGRGQRIGVDFQGSRPFNGSISNVLIKDYAMTQSEITALYNRDKIYFEDSNPSGHLGDFGVRGDLNLPNLIGTGNDYACIDENGSLYRSAGACS